EVFSATSGPVGRLEMQINGTAQPSRRLVESVWGEYQGICGEEPTNLQLKTYRTTEDTIRVGNPFGAYEIRGQIADKSTFQCGDETLGCVADLVKSGTYDYFNGRLNVFGKRQQYECQVT